MTWISDNAAFDAQRYLSSGQEEEPPYACCCCGEHFGKRQGVEFAGESEERFCNECIRRDKHINYYLTVLRFDEWELRNTLITSKKI
jgi:hypothetical protein